ncbi:unnamed protein product, partial [Prorocentrum cordatum]
ATFGPTRSSLAELSQTTLEAWVSAQIASPVGSHREYYRKRVNSRIVTDQWGGTDYSHLGFPRSRCSAGSRWHAFALKRADRTKRVQITGNKMYVDGAHRSDIDPDYTLNGMKAPDNCTDKIAWPSMGDCANIVSWGWPLHVCNVWTAWIENLYCQQTCFDAGWPYTGDDCSPGWASLEYDGFLCTVEEELGGIVTLSTSAGCEGDTTTTFRNPTIWFNTSVTPEALSFQQVRPGVVTLAQNYGTGACDLGEFVYDGGQYYLEDPRLELLQNDLTSPSGGELNTCRAVP